MLMKAIALAALSLMTLQAENQIYELRTYVSPEHKFENLLARFRDHTVKLFEKHGMHNVGYWIAADEPRTLIYVLAHKNREAAKTAWDAFRKDPVWVKAKAESETSGAIVDKVTSVFMNPADFSKLK